MAGNIEQLVDELERSYHEAQERMSDPAVYNDHREAAAAGRRLKELEAPHRLAQEWLQIHDDLEAARGDGVLRELVPELEERSHAIEEELRVALAPTDPADSKDVIIEIRQGVGGDEAALWAGDVYRSTGPGGQSVNTTDSAVRITHLPTGLVVSMQDEKSQLQNRQKALRVLRARLYELEREKQQAELDTTRRSQIGSGGRAEKIRTYNFPENRVTDHRIKLTVHQLDRALQGELDEFTDALSAEERRRALGE